MARLTELVAAKGMRLFAVIDQAAEAREAGLRLRETVLVLFGSPAAGTPVMDAARWPRSTCRSRCWSGMTAGRRR